MRALRLVVLVFVAAVSVGCSNANLQRPTAALRGMNVGGVDEEGFTMNFDVDVKNPNTVALPMAKTDYKLAVEGVRLVDGSAKGQETTIPAGGSAAVTVPVKVKFDDLLKAKEAILASGGNVKYSLDGGIDFGSGLAALGIGGLRVPLTYSGTLPLRQMVSDPQLLMKSPAARRLASEALGGVGAWMKR